MANIYFGDGYTSNDGNWNDAGNWYSSPETVCYGGCCPSYGPGTLAGRLPNSGGDSVVLMAPVTTGPSGGWSGNIAISSGNNTRGQIAAGSYSGMITGSSNGIANISGGNFSGAVTNASISGGSFSNSVTVNGFNYQLGISGGAFSGAVSTVGSVTGGSFTGTLTLNGVSGNIQTLSGVTTSIPVNISLPVATGWKITGGTYGGGISVTRQNASGSAASSLSLSGGSCVGNLSIGGPGAQTGILTVTLSGMNFSGGSISTGVARTLFAVSGGSYAPPAVYTPAVRSGNYLSFAASAIPPDPGFAAAGLSYSPSILIQGTSNDILGAGLP